VTIALVDDQLLGAVLRGNTPRSLRSRELYTTGHWYVRLCQAVLSASERRGALSRPFAELPEPLRARAMDAVLELPAEVGLVSLRTLGPVIARLRPQHRLNILGIEVVAAARHLGAEVHLSAPSPLVEEAIATEHLECTVHRSPPA
jgi:hypothetical protein